MFKKLLFMFLVGVVAGCGGSSSTGGGTTTPPPGSAKGTLVGKVSDNSTGLPLSGVTVTDGTINTTTAADGAYTLAESTAASGKAITFTKDNYAFGTKVVTLVANATTRADVSLVPVTYSTTITSQATAQTLTVPGSPGQVQLPVNALVTSSGGAPSGNITANLTPIDPSSNPQIMPGNFTTSAGGMIESFGAIEINFKDASGNNLNLATGKTATIRIPVAASATSPAATMPAFYFNSTTGKWVQEGTLTLGGTAPSQYYEGSVTHFSYWNADMAYDTTCISGKVVDANGTAKANAKVEAQGRDYIGTSEAWTATDGTFSILVKPGSVVIVTASSSNSLSQSEIVVTGTAGTSCTPLPANLTLGSTTSGSAKIKLTWGSNPRDLDSHLTGPITGTGSNATAATRFHVYYSNEGTLTSPPFAELDVDDTSSFGPEVITINRFEAGTYRYSVHHFTGTGSIFTSPARVELQLNGETRVFTPPDPGATVLGDDSVWVVFELLAGSSGSVSVSPVNLYLTNVDDAAVAKTAANAFEEYFLFRNMPRK